VPCASQASGRSGASSSARFAARIASSIALAGTPMRHKIAEPSAIASPACAFANLGSDSIARRNRPIACLIVVSLCS
jgi:hypothetical protein